MKSRIFIQEKYSFSFYLKEAVTARATDRPSVWSHLRLIDTDIVVLPESAHPRAFCPLILIAWERGVENKSHLAVQPSRQPNILVFLRTLNWCLISSYNCETHLTSTFHLYLFNMPGTFCLLSDRMCFISSQNTPAVKWLQTHWVHNHTLLSPYRRSQFMLDCLYWSHDLRTINRKLPNYKFVSKLMFLWTGQVFQSNRNMHFTSFSKNLFFFIEIQHETMRV